jgi:tetratricopeptide (TPR) repeat protein
MASDNIIDGTIYPRQEDNRAIANWNRVVRTGQFSLDPSTYIPYLDDAVIGHLVSDNPNRAIQTLDEALSVGFGKMENDEYRRLLLWKADLLRVTDKRRQALSEATRAVHQVPNSEAYASRALIYSDIGDAIDKIINRSTKTRDQGKINAMTARRNKAYRRAISDITKSMALSSKPNKEHDIFTAYCYLSVNDRKNARAHLQRADKLNGNDGPFAKDAKYYWKTIFERELDDYLNQLVKPHSYQKMPAFPKPNIN